MKRKTNGTHLTPPPSQHLTKYMNRLPIGHFIFNPTSTSPKKKFRPRPEYNPPPPQPAGNKWLVLYLCSLDVTSISHVCNSNMNAAWGTIYDTSHLSMYTLIHIFFVCISSASTCKISHIWKYVELKWKLIFKLLQLVNLWTQKICPVMICHYLSSDINY